MIRRVGRVPSFIRTGSERAFPGVPDRCRGNRAHLPRGLGFRFAVSGVVDWMSENNRSARSQPPMTWHSALRTFAIDLARPTLLAVLACAALGIWPVRAEEPTRSPPVEAPGMEVHIDPTTGEFTDTPPPQVVQPGTLEPTEKRALPQEGLVETLSPVPGGGVMIDLKGRFQSPLTATVGPDGKVKVEHK